ncbi:MULTISPECIES: hypothetical protein [unclassified Variovorax]|uniref:hypothetical protein n=1 Tax=unclassified Variovorax TaxID=663243 RepID=UPI0032E78477
MGEINIPRAEQEALRAVDTEALRKLIEQSLREERPYALRDLRLENCGLYVVSRLRQYETALAEHGKAKAEKKRAETGYRARRAGSDLLDAIQQMKDRVETEEKEGQYFYVDDLIMPPSRFSERVTVRVNYNWRRSVEDKWAYGSITFVHDVDSRPDYTLPQPSRKPSAAKQERDRQEKLYDEWNHLMKLGLHSVREYFREGGDGAAIPQTFQAKADSYTRGLNNFSARFWLARSSASE